MSQDTPNTTPTRSRRSSTFRRLITLVAPFRWWMALSALLGFVTIGSSIGLMTTAAWIIATAALHPSVAELQIAIVGVRFFGITRGVFRYLERYVSHQTTFRLLARLRVWFYQRIEPLAPARLMQYRSGDLLSRMVADIDTLENFYLRVIAPPAVALMIALTVWIFLASLDSQIAGVLLLFLALAGLGVPILVRWLSRTDLITARADLNVALVDGIQGMADLVAYGQAERQSARVDTLSRRMASAQRRTAFTGALHTGLVSLLMSLAVLAVLVIAIPLVHAGQLEGVMLAVLVLAAITSFEAVLPLPLAMQHLSSNLEAARRLFEIIDARPDVHDPATPRPLPEQYDLELCDVRFRYNPQEPPVLDGISFSLPHRGKLAIVGASGAGKSTLVNLLLRFWDYDQGEIRLGGHDLCAYHQEQVRSLIGVVAQSTYLFNGTIRDNLLLANPTAAEDDLVRAARLAQIHDFITALPQGYNTWIGEQGLRLSGGERQRLAIARVLLKNAPILILDEPTANLDPVTEREMMQAVLAAAADRTTLMITHRLVGLERFDVILVLQAGKIIERGQHADLLQINGYYRRMWELQQQVLLAD